jgi:hypothetical protein
MKEVTSNKSSNRDAKSEVKKAESSIGSPNSALMSQL